MTFLRDQERNPRGRILVDMHPFCGLGHETAALSLGLTVYRVRQK